MYQSLFDLQARRESLAHDDCARRLFEKFERYLNQKGLKARKGQILHRQLNKLTP